MRSFRHHQFEFDVAGADALAAFNHPFAFAAHRELVLGEGLPRIPERSAA
jgi:hypothetical protein